jgi:NDP-sugar pyrophosphorylase family protein
MRAFILAGGKGTRLYPYTMVLPKPLVPIGEIPILEIILHQLAQAGFDDIVLSVGYLESLMRAYFQHQRIPGGTSLDFIQEVEPLGTAGSLSLLDKIPTDPLLVMNGDILTTLDYLKLMDYHRMRDAALTIATHERIVKVDLGVLELDDARTVVDYKEKPQLPYSVSMGIYVYGPRAFQYINAGERLDLPDLVLRLIAAGETVAAYPSDDLWLDIGSPDDHGRACQLFDEQPERFLPPALLARKRGEFKE